MREVEYTRTGSGGDEPAKASLLEFVYDTPRLAICGIFPPRDILNIHLERGYAGGGMGSGCVWTPFKVTEEEYFELAKAIRATAPSELGSASRFISIKLAFDPALDDLKDLYEWASAIGAKHRAEFHAKIREAERKYYSQLTQQPDDNS